MEFSLELNLKHNKKKKKKKKRRRSRWQARKSVFYDVLQSAGTWARERPRGVGVVVAFVWRRSGGRSQDLSIAMLQMVMMMIY